ncbi:MAG: DUF2207 domain-containing protein [Propionibacterium sp.]|nr:DUF2207 domain-containing protein [Propionibacterium sp.]
MAASYVVSGEVAADGSLSITETITFDGAAPNELEQRLATTRPQLNYTELEYTITDVTATAGGENLASSVSEDDDYLVIRIDSSKAGDDPIEISYTVVGAAVALPRVEHQAPLTEVSWRVLQGLSVGVDQVSGEIALPANTHTYDIDCAAGPPVAPSSCTTYASGTFNALYPQFTDGPRGAGEMVEVTFSVPSASVAPNQKIVEHWTLDRAFTAHGLPLLLAAAALVVGAAALFLLHRVRGSDAMGGNPILVARFEPVGVGEERFVLLENLRPGEVGTLTDERVDPVDITATVIDLAQRGHLTIIQLPHANVNTNIDWTFERREGSDDLQGYEKILLDAIAPLDGEAVTISQISGVLDETVREVQDAIYDEVVAEGWFAARPDQVRNTWGRVGAVALGISIVALGLLAYFANLGLLGLVLVGLSVGLIWVSQQMPRRTPKGTSLLSGLQVLSMTLATHPTDRLPPDDLYAEISRVLPYAIVLGGLDRWLKALAEADDDPGVPDPDDLGWYRAPDNWQLSDLPFSIESFITVLHGTLYARH